jgi:WD40 repeat protein
MKINDDEVLFHLDTLRSCTKALGIASNMPLAGSELKLPLDQYSKLWEALNLWVGIAQRRNIDKQSVQESSDLLRILFELHHAPQTTSLHISHLPSDAKAIGLSPDGLRAVIGTSDGAYLCSITAMDNEPHRLGDYSGYVELVAFSPDGSWIATGAENRTVRLWNATTGDVVQVLDGQTSIVNAIAFSPDGSQVASGSDDCTVILWDVSAGYSTCTFIGHTSPVLAVAFSPDGSQVASGSLDKTVRLWKASTDATIHALKGHTFAVSSVAFSVDGSRVVSGSNDCSVRLWDSATGESIAVLRGHDYCPTYVGFSSDGLHITSRDEKGYTRIWDARRYLPSTPAAAASEPSGLLLPVFMFDPDTRWIVAKRMDNGQVFPVYQIPKHEEIRVLAMHSADNRWHQLSSGYKVALALDGGRIQVIDCSSLFV